MVRQGTGCGEGARLGAMARQGEGHTDRVDEDIGIVAVLDLQHEGHEAGRGGRGGGEGTGQKGLGSGSSLLCKSLSMSTSLFSASIYV